MLQFNSFYKHIADSKLSFWLENLPTQLKEFNTNAKNDPWNKKFQDILQQMPTIHAENIALQDTITATNASLPQGEIKKLKFLLQQLMPWRKGPYNLYDIFIDTEWRSDLKWNRIINAIKPLDNKLILDVGCGNGYHMWRMLEQNAKMVIGIDPTLLFLYQFLCIKKLLNYDQTPDKDRAINLIPIGIEQMPSSNVFDTVFSMGVLYHRKSPLEHFMQLKNQLAKDGQLILETLVIDGDENTVLVPKDRYAKMKNVYFIPTVDALSIWLEKVGFKHITCIDVSTTTLIEQRKTAWITSESLNDFLDPNDINKTIEGYPAPKRAIITATK